MGKHFTISEKSAGELAVRYLSEKAQCVYSDSDFDVAKRDDRFFIVSGGDIINSDLTEEELDEALCDWAEEE